MLSATCDVRALFPFGRQPTPYRSSTICLHLSVIQHPDSITIFDTETPPIFATMAEQNLAFLFTVLKYSELTPDWWAIGAECSKVEKATKSQKDRQ